MQPGVSSQDNPRVGVAPTSANVGQVRALAEALRANVGRVMVGKVGAIDLLLVALLAEGHALIEDVPGVGKTLLARALARSLDLRFSRIQGTADLLPGDVTGISFFNQQVGAFEFRPGPLFASTRAGRRGQPRHATHPIRAARGDAGAAGDGGWPDDAAAAALPR